MARDQRRDHGVQLGIRRRPGPPPHALREGQGQAVEHQRSARLVHLCRPRLARPHAGLLHPDLRLVRDCSQEPLAKALNTYVMQDEARHVAFGRLALREFYPQLTEPERAEREEFVVYACYLMRDRFLAEEVWDNLGLDRDRCKEYV